MSRSHHVISANDLRNGLNVYFLQEGDSARWDTDITRATLYDDDAVESAFERAKQDMADNIVVDCLVVPVDENRQPLTTREKIRAGGPSIKYGHAADL